MFCGSQNRSGITFHIPQEQLNWHSYQPVIRTTGAEQHMTISKLMEYKKRQNTAWHQTLPPHGEIQSL